MSNVDTSPGANVSGDGVKPEISVEEVDVQAVVDELQTSLQKIKSEIGGIYSRQDKDREVLKQLTEQVKNFSKQGKSVDEAVKLAEQAVLGKLRDQGDTQAAPEKVDAGTSAEMAVLKGMGFKESDVIAIGLAAKHKGDLTSLVAEANTLRPTPKPASASSAPMPSGSSIGTAPEGKMSEEHYQTELAKIATETVSHDERLKKISALKARAREGGLEKY